MTGIFSKKKTERAIPQTKPEIPMQKPIETVKEIKPRRERERFVMYEIVYNNMKGLGKKDITTKEFRNLLCYFRVPKNLWFVIMKDMEKLYGIKCNYRKIIIKGG